jgi:predicted nucleic acid-binding protein
VLRLATFWSYAVSEGKRTSRFAAIAAEPFTKEMGHAAAKLDAEAKQAVRVIPFPDLLIGTTALHFDYPVATWNLRHFLMIPASKF